MKQSRMSSQVLQAAHKDIRNTYVHLCTCFHHWLRTHLLRGMGRGEGFFAATKGQQDVYVRTSTRPLLAPTMGIHLTSLGLLYACMSHTATSRTCWKQLTRVALISSSYLCSLCCKVCCNCRKVIVSHTYIRWRNTAPLLHTSNTGNRETNRLHHSKYSNGHTCAGGPKVPCTYVCMLLGSEANARMQITHNDT